MSNLTWNCVTDKVMCVETETINEALIYLNENLDNKFYYSEDAEYDNKKFTIIEYDPIKKERVKYWKAWKGKEMDGATVIEFRISDREY